MICAGKPNSRKRVTKENARDGILGKELGTIHNLVCIEETQQHLGGERGRYYSDAKGIDAG